MALSSRGLAQGGKVAAARLRSDPIRPLPASVDFDAGARAAAPSPPSGHAMRRRIAAGR